jgi:small neutral amino acid transporter SnatA (MarC family)
VSRLTTALATTAGAFALGFGVGAPPERCPAIDVAAVEASADSAARWIIDNQQPDGRWLYEYDRGDDTISNGYNVVRHAGVMTSLYQAGARGIVGATASADRGLAWALDHLVERDNWVGMTTSRTVQAGTNALLLAGLVERRLDTGDTSYDATMAALARFLEHQTEPSGALLAYYDLGPDRARPDTYSIYYTGEAYWALGRLHRVEPEAGWGDVADRMGAYMATERDDVEDIWPPLADHWSGYGLAETAAFRDRAPGRPLTEDELEFVRRQGGLIGQRVRSISQRFGPWGVVVRGTFTPRGGGYGVFGEGLTGLWRAAQLDDRLADERGALAERAICIAGLAIEAQSDAADAAEYSEPGMVEGAWFIDDVTRMDDQQHALSALLLTIPILEATPAADGHTSPSVWLWLLVVVGVLNPIRAARAVPTGSRRGRVEVALAGGLAGAAILLAVAATSGWLIDVADTSRPAMRVAAAALCLLTAAVDLVRGRAAPTPALDGRAAAIVPVAIPFVARPAVVFAGLAVVADHGLARYALSLGLGLAILVAVSATANRDGAAGLVTTWISRLLSAAAVVASILLGVHAVFDI